MAPFQSRLDCRLALMTELAPQLREVRDFFFKQALPLAPELSYLHRPGVLADQTIFRLQDLGKHLNNPFLNLEFVQFFDRGQAVDLSEAYLYKSVQRRRIRFVDRLLLQRLLEGGAACVLEGLDILEPPINALMASLDRAHLCTFSNAVVFFSQRGNEAYRGHFDTDDVLVIHLAGTKKWRVHRRLQARRTNRFDLPEAEMGPLEAEITMRPGDLMFVRAGTPHRVETLDDYSMHLSFDLVDRTVNVETALDLLLKRYDRDALRPHSSTNDMLEKVAAIGRTEEFRRELEALQREHKSGYEEFRHFLDRNRIGFFDRLIGVETKT